MPRHVAFLRGINLGDRRVKNVVALGALQAASEILPEASLLESIDRFLAKSDEILERNHEAFARGAAAAREAIEAVTV